MPHDPSGQLRAEWMPGWLCAGDRRTDGLARHWVGLWGTGEGQNGSLKNPLNLHNPLGGPIHPDKRCSPYLHLVVGQCVKEPFSSMYLKFTMKYRFMFDNADLPNDLGWICLSIGRGLHFLVRMSTTLPVPSSHSHLNLLLTKTLQPASTASQDYMVPNSQRMFDGRSDSPSVYVFKSQNRSDLSSGR